MCLKGQKKVQNFYILSSIVVTYFIAAIPFGLLVSNAIGVDLRKIGSGNIGATNVYRGCGLKWAIVVFICDGLKGFGPVYVATLLWQDPLFHLAIGLVSVVGHSLSCFVQFKGGKGVATGLGVVFGLSPIIGLILMGVGVSSILLTRYVAPTSIVCSIIAPFLFYLWGYPLVYVAFFVIISLLIIIRHIDNIKRLFKGNENKI